MDTQEVSGAAPTRAVRGSLHLRRLMLRAGGMCLAVALALTLTSRAQGQVTIPSGSHSEAGAPPFSAVSIETLGLTGAPTALERLPDGRLLVMAPRQFAMGDGVRWQVFSQAAGDPVEVGLRPAIGADGTIYAATPGGIARVQFATDGTWHLVQLTSWSASPDAPLTLPLAVAENLGETWLWHSLTGAVMAWQPTSAAPQLLATADVIEHAFRLKGEVFLSERFRGRLYRLRDGKQETVLDSSSLAAITCTVPLDPDTVIAGTYGLGLQIFDGTRLRPLTSEGPLGSGARIQDLCATHGGFVAVAIDNFGLAFISRDGRIVQTLDRTVDSRLTRVKRLVPTADGAVWVLLDSGLLRVAFPTPVSYFEPFLGPGVTTVHPHRVAGELWLLADGRLQRAVYDASGRFTGLELDSPPQVFVNSFSDSPGVLVAGTEQGAWCRPPGSAEWTRFAPDVENLRILGPDASGQRWLFAARGEVGWLERTDAGVHITERLPVPGLTNVFNRPLRDDQGRIWMELGTGRIAMASLHDGAPQVKIFGAGDGLPNNWPQIFLEGREIRFNLGDVVKRFDATQQRFVEDAEFVRRLPGLRQIFGRAAIAPDGRLWISGDGLLHVYEKNGTAWRETEPRIHVAFQPYYFTFEEGGVVWMHAQHRLARYDPAFTAPPVTTPSAQITHVHVPATNRHFFDLRQAIPPLTARENSLVVHFTARSDDFATPLAFDVRLTGASDEWVSAGNSGSAVFNNLKNGRYLLEVSPVVEGVRGAPAALAFTIQPPWFRTIPAYLAGLALLAALVTIVARAWSYMARRERRRLEHLVAQRTTDLRGSEERYRRLSEELEERVETRTRELHLSNQRLNETNRELEAFSYSVSHDLRAPLRGIDGWSHALLEDYGAVLDATGRSYIARVRNEAQRLGHLIDDLLTLSRTTRSEVHPKPMDLSALVQALATRVAETHPARSVAFTCAPGLSTHGDPVLLETALTNLLDNAWKFTTRVAQPLVEFGRADTEHGPAFFIRDNGAGFDMRHAAKLFGVFQRMHAQDEFPGTGIGLATVQRIIIRHGGRIWATSTPGMGATFFFTLPDPGRAP